MPEPKSSLPLTDYKALRDSLRQKRELLPQAALKEALKAYLKHAKLEVDRPRAVSSRRQPAAR